MLKKFKRGNVHRMCGAASRVLVSNAVPIGRKCRELILGLLFVSVEVLPSIHWGELAPEAGYYIFNNIKNRPC
jgi:hypothetical protein